MRPSSATANGMRSGRRFAGALAGQASGAVRDPESIVFPWRMDAAPMPDNTPIPHARGSFEKLPEVVVAMTQRYTVLRDRTEDG
ncbi:hypothetical protein GQ56_0110820 [Burkholderia paludis]|nr:hypothetical protein GQ56_0110820 [Burkholderia paludis]